MYLIQMLAEISSAQSLANMMDENQEMAAFGAQVGDESAYLLGRELAGMLQGILLKRMTYAQGKDVGQITKSDGNLPF